MEDLGYLAVLFGGLDVAGEDDVAEAVVREARQAELIAIVDALCGEVLRVVPLRLSRKNAGACHRYVERCKLESNEFAGEILGGRFNYLNDLGVNRGKIAAHAQVNAGLSGAFSFFLLCDRDVISWWKAVTGHTFSGETNAARLEGMMSRNAADQCLDMLNIAMRSIPETQYLTFEFRRNNASNNQILLFTLPELSRPNSHCDGKEEGPTNQCRILWDLHPRGRILSVYNQDYGVFLENCGVEFCSQIMCGRQEMRKMPADHKYVKAANKLEHQGWDDCRHREKGCPMVTALLDLKIVGPDPTNDLVGSVMTAINSDTFQNVLKQEMERYVIIRMEILRVGCTFEEVQEMQRKQNYEIVKRWWESFYPAEVVPCYTDCDKNYFLDVITDAYLAQMYNR
jgi:hypothetical protein